jgi:DNA polymerase III subunit gamma/tau
MLYQEERPSTFDDVIGNEAEIKQLKKTLSTPNGAHAFLISGPSGCGKTTLARIAAKALGASDFSIQEINTANNRGIDTARELIERTRMASADGAPMVFIIDEVHAVTKDWQGAMLKPLEDIPEHVYWFLCTTNPEKLLPTIKTRCCPVKVVSLTEEELLKLIRGVNRKRSLGIPIEFLSAIAKASNGSARMALTYLEKAIGIESEKELDRILAAGDETEKETIDLCRALLNGTWKTVAPIIKDLKTRELDPEGIRHAVLGYMSAVLLSGNASADTAAWAIECFSEPFYASNFPGVVLAAWQTLHP